ncbi:hypothetical protein ACFUJY_29485 [Streptomyces sp. NPDC057249]|uniref:hypothetical protein n=1 Tax=Streptomyces sp. NPDC057249 TaxID=3346067 RepID=UPI00363FFA83
MNDSDCWVVKARVRAGGQVTTAQVALSGLHWAALPVEARCLAVRQVRRTLSGAAGICEFCAETVEGPCRRPFPCGPVSTLLSVGGHEYPLTGDMLTDYGSDPGRMLALVATARGRWGRQARALVPAAEWQGTHPQAREAALRCVVEELVRCCGAGPDPLNISTLIWDGECEFPYPGNWPEALPGQDFVPAGSYEVWAEGEGYIPLDR